jgi:hypothetical protein
MQLLEKIRVREKPFKHLTRAKGDFTKTEPLIFACRNDDTGEIEISMQYEGLPLKPMKRFLEAIEERWESYT